MTDSIKKVTHIPGPWTVGAKDRRNRDMSVYTTINEVTVSIAYCDLHSSYGLCVANARLIAAAPDLLEALLDILPELESIGPLDKFEKARAAIAKATGEKL